MVIVYKCTTPEGREYVSTDPKLPKMYGHSVAPTTMDQVMATWATKGIQHALGMAYLEAPTLWSASVPDRRKEWKPLFPRIAPNTRSW